MSFRFKQFEVIQSKSAMKVGTDGVLLGAWADYNNPTTILDIGSGTGLIALMLAQRFLNSKVFAIEVDKDASEEALLNFSNSIWSERLEIINKDIFKYFSDSKYDLIVSNPPFFKEDLNSPNRKRALARNGFIDISDLFSKVSSLMHDSSQFELIIPFSQMESYQKEAQKVGLVKSRVMYINPTSSKSPNRVLLSFSFQNTKEHPALESYLTIEMNGRHDYSEEYKQLTKEFYLKF